MNSLATANLAVTGLAAAPLALVGLVLTASGALTRKVGSYLGKQRD
jgi:hypothetical protein